MARAHTPAQTDGNARRSGNAGVTAAMKLSQLRCRESWKPQNFSCYFPALPPIFFHRFRGFPARPHRGKGSPLAALAGSLLIPNLPDEELRE